jgi:hypothetical protein
MTQELFYTSAPKGLRPGTRGFCTVAATQGLTPVLIEKLEALSGYRELFPPHDPRANRNPVAYSHVRLQIGGRPLHVLSRVCAAGLDYTERTNKFAHHVVVDSHELVAGGPAWLLAQPGFMEPAWDGSVRTLPAGRAVIHGNATPAICRAWQAATGDAGWAGVLAEALSISSERLVYLVFEPGMDLLPLIAEAIALLPPQRRWEATFSTYYAKTTQAVSCAWRCVAAGTPEVQDARRLPNTLILDLTASLGQARGGALVDCARTGKMPDWGTTRPTRPVAPVPFESPARVDPELEGFDLAPLLDEEEPSDRHAESSPGPPARSEQAAHTPSVPLSHPYRPPPPLPKRNLAATPNTYHVAVALGVIGGCLATLVIGIGIYFMFGRHQPEPSIMATRPDNSSTGTKWDEGPGGTKETDTQERVLPREGDVRTPRAMAERFWGAVRGFSLERSVPMVQTLREAVRNARRARQAQTTKEPHQSNQENAKPSTTVQGHLKALFGSDRANQPGQPLLLTPGQENTIADLEQTEAKGARELSVAFLEQKFVYSQAIVATMDSVPESKSSAVIRCQVPEIDGNYPVATIYLDQDKLKLRCSDERGKAVVEKARAALGNVIITVHAPDRRVFHWSLVTPGSERWPGELHSDSRLIPVPWNSNLPPALTQTGFFMEVPDMTFAGRTLRFEHKSLGGAVRFVTRAAPPLLLPSKIDTKRQLVESIALELNPKGQLRIEPRVRTEAVAKDELPPKDATPATDTKLHLKGDLIIYAKWTEPRSGQTLRIDLFRFQDRQTNSDAHAAP